ncbi:ArsR/SmtB family transcription factor [Amycolatopsis sp. RTGN1]|uniref:ArsR/SmtB family transcription factor n=1 Tax=Amycolatopsis ponsaeliensis TaxID=2992142 RepID=UPI00254C810F|nr:winged helix-turn-helix domain-containing protein [Amycolatopsis sp. RTGN1]
MASTPPQARTEELVRAMRAFGSASRLELLRAMLDPRQLDAAPGEVSEHGVCLALLARTVGIAGPTALQHLSKLVEAGLCVKTADRRGGGFTFYRRDENAITDVADRLRHV